MPKTPHLPQQGFEKSLYYHSISEANKLGSTDSSETILEGTEIKCDQKEMTLKYGTEGK